MLFRLLQNEDLQHLLAKNKLLQEDITLADRLGLFSTGLGFIADILAFQELKDPDEGEDPPLPPSIQEEESGGDDTTKNQNLLVWFLILLLVISAFSDYDSGNDQDNDKQYNN
ncbi:hypothetical protein JCM16358_03770 [Halanaerocella petrolearia]